MKQNLGRKRDHKSHKSMSRPHPNRKNKLRVNKKRQRQVLKKEGEQNERI